MITIPIILSLTLLLFSLIKVKPSDENNEKDQLLSIVLQSSSSGINEYYLYEESKGSRINLGKYSTLDAANEALKQRSKQIANFHT